jgi:hypothetical protein
MEKTVEVVIPVAPEAARFLDDPVRRQALGRYLSELLKGGGLHNVLAEAIADLKREVRANGLTDDEIDAELASWRAERQS